MWLLDTNMSEDDESDNKEPVNVDEALNSANCLELFNDVAHFGEFRGLPSVDESRLQDKDRFKCVLLTASVFIKQQNLYVQIFDQLHHLFYSIRL